MYPLAEDERLLWSGRPRRYPRRYADYHIYLVTTVGFGVLVALGVIAVARFDVYSAVFQLWPVFFGMALGLGSERNRRRKAMFGGLSYLVTERRVVFVAYRPEGIEFRWVWLPDLGVPRVRDYGDGTGTVGFGAPLRVRMRDLQFRAESPLATMVPELVAIEAPAHVAELIARMRSAAVGSRAE
ncbi:hypothetical protein CU254_31245 [Amycolatopsis sp. AA4]|uniref:hypothetical protein n=1 Tax=Actinomycetes TaxID=1760 RepID=UPI0001B53B10|nr:MULTISPECIES: hypothetical protein [Actinomycetes]ATY14397.1 hypothetical protein CU254_31245 [Amycolatopsis sp. AA4]EFL10482.1 hypothetical protein SSMG_06153 [Streptomyces sp. AA4]